MTTINVINYGGIARVDLIGDVILLAGRGGAGKSSILSAMAAAVTGALYPPGVTRATAACLVRPGTQSASVTVTDDKGGTRIVWPGDGTVRGDTITASAIAAGRLSFLDLALPERSSRLVHLLNARPTEAELLKALADAGLPESVAPAVVKMVASRGYEEACAIAEKQKTERAALWRKVTGAKSYLPATAAKWRPDGWSIDLEGIKDATPLLDAVTKGRELVEQMIKTAASGDAEIERLKERAALLEPARRRLTEAEMWTRQAADLTRHWGARLDALPPIPSAGHPCPECGALLTGSGPYALGSGTASQDTIAKALQQQREMEASYDAADKAARLRVSEEAVVQAEVQALELEARKLGAIIADRKEGSIGTHADVESARQSLALAEQRYSAWTQMRDAEAERVHAEWADISAKVLSPGGIRRTKMIETLRTFNQELSEICNVGGVESVKITEEMTLTTGNLHESVLSTSQRFLLSTVVQIAIANLDESQALLIDVDRALDSHQKQSVINMAIGGASETVRLIMIAITETKPRSELSLKDAGSTYWVSGGDTAAGGIATPLA